MRTVRCWSLLTLGDERQYGGNEGYADDPEVSYRYDSSVANSRQIGEGDLVCVRDGVRLLGVARIRGIDVRAGVKLRQRCPVCRTTAIKRRKSTDPPWRCSNSHEFQNPVREQSAVTEFVASYGDSFVRARDAITPTQLKSAALRPNDQMSIEELDVGRLEAGLTGTYPATSDLVAGALARKVIDASDADTPDGAAFVPSMADQREKVLRAIRQRRGQQAFRRALVKRYGPRCLVSDCALLDVVEAAHIWPHRGTKDNHVGNGLLLRADLHTLYDLNLLGIQPETLAVRFHPDAVDPGYESFEGRRLVVGRHAPSQAALTLRWDEFIASQGERDDA